MRRFWSISLGNLFEHYDTALFGLLSPFLAPLFFPEHDPLVALILTYAMIPLGMLARPLGALFFGKIGDFYGRERSLFLSLIGMSIVSLLIACCPLYAEIGLLAPLLFCLARTTQNFLAAGEIMGGAILLLEESPPKKHDLLSSFYNASTVGGILLASLLVFLVSHFDSMENSWRLLYLIGSLTALFGSLLRANLPQKTYPLSWPSPFKTLWQMRQTVGIIALTSGFSYATFSLALVLMNGFIPLVTPFSKEAMLSINTLLLVIDFATLPLFGWIASKVGREKLMLYAAFCATAAALPLSMALEEASLLTILLIRFSFVLVGVAFFAPYHAFAKELVPHSHRYLVLSFGYALGSQIFGGPTTALSLWLFKTTGHISSITWYWGILALSTTFLMASMIHHRKASLANT